MLYYDLTEDDNFAAFVNQTVICPFTECLLFKHIYEYLSKFIEFTLDLGQNTFIFAKLIEITPDFSFLPLP